MKGEKGSIALNLTLSKVRLGDDEQYSELYRDLRESDLDSD